MAEHTWKKHFWRNAFSNYLRTVLRLVSGLVLFRLTFQNLSAEAFGFYSLLWSMFGYTILLDFGLGFTAQKAVAEKMASGEIEELNKLLSTIFWSFAALALGLLLVFALAENSFLDWIKVSAANRSEFGRAYLIFFCAMALAFPTGIFPEVLRGLQRIDLANWVTIVALLLNAGLLTWALLAHAGLALIVFISVATTLSPNIVCYFMARSRIPGFDLGLRHYQFSAVRGVLSFSVVAYLITFTNLVMSRTDQAVISFTIGVAFVTLYQAGYKASEMFGLFSVQMQDALSPAAAQLSIQKDQAGLRELLLQGMRLTALLTTPIYGLCVVCLDPLIRILTGLKHVDAETWWVGQTLLFATFSSLVTNSCAKRILMMSGWERPVLYASLVDAALNLVLSLLLVFKLGVLGVAVGTMLPTVLVGWFWLLPITARFCELTVAELARQVMTSILVPLGASLVTLALIYWLVPVTPETGFLGCIWRGSLVMASVLALGYPFLRQLRKGKHNPAVAAAPVP